jgi:nicotinate phosphoribosyltransferase
VDAGALSPGSSALLTDHYELTMLDGALRSGVAGRRAAFEVFARRLPEGRRYGVAAGAGRLVEAIERFRFGDEELAFLAERGIVSQPTLDWLAGFRFTGDVWGYAEGETYFPGSPILVVEAPFGEAVLLETLALSVLNHDSAVAAAASRMTLAAGERPCIEMGSRRTHEAAAPAAARAAYIAGFASTSNLAAGRCYGIPTRGTSAHAFTLVHDSEKHAFTAQVESLGSSTTLLVDTYDVRTAVRTAVEVAGTSLGAVRLDSGDLLELAREVRAQLDELGATSTRIIVTSDLDEHAIAALAAAPVDGYGVGTALVTGAGAPTAGLVYKLAARAESAAPGAPLRPVAKRSVGKPSLGGRKTAVRRYGPDGCAAAEAVLVGAPDNGREYAPRNAQGDGRKAARPLLVPLVRKGETVGREPLAAARDRHRRSLAELPLTALPLSRGEPAIPTVYEEVGT